MKIICHNDPDGRCAGALTKLVYPEAEVFLVDYGGYFPWDQIEQNETVFLEDFSLQPFELMEKLNDSCSLIWIDHHISAIKLAKSHNFRPHNTFSRQVVGKAGCELTWEVLYGLAEEKLKSFTGSPCTTKAIRLIGRHDVWKWQETPGSLEFHYGFKLHPNTHPNNTEFWRRLFTDDNFVDKFIQKGKVIREYVEADNKEQSEHFSFEVSFEGYTCLAANAGLKGSLLFGDEAPNYPLTILFVFDPHAMMWKISLHSEQKDFDVSKICEKYGGGGHRGAGGFQCKELPFKLPMRGD